MDYVVTKRNGERVEFATDLTVDDAADVVGSLPLTEFSGSLMLAYRAGRLSEKQRLWLLKLAHDATAPRPTGPFLPIVEALHGFRERGKLKGKAKLKLVGAVLETAIAGANPGALYVYTSHKAEYVGKITPQGALVWNGPERPEVLRAIEHANRDPVEAAKEYGQAEGECACCKATLTDPVSKWISIGPICLERLAGKGARKLAEREYREAMAEAS